MEGFIFIIIAAFIGLVMKRFGQEEGTREPKQRPVRPGQKQANIIQPAAAEKPEQRKTSRQLQETKRSAALKAKETKPSSVIDTWTGEDMVQGIILAEILGPPKSKRKK